MPSQFKEHRANNGFDAAAVPPWVMVPLTGFNLVKLTNAAGLTVTSSAPAIAKIVTFGRLAPDGHQGFMIVGKRVGNVVIHARRGPTLCARLDVSVKRKKTVKIAFNFVKDNAGHATTRTSASVNGWVAAMNRIFLPQANILIMKQSSRNVAVPANLGAVVRFSTHIAGAPAAAHEWDDVIALRDNTADLNLFFVWEYEQDATPGTDHTDAGTLGGNCIFEDNAGTQIGETLAHETGHFLGAPDMNAAADRHLLMFGITDTRGQKIPKAHANTMNP